MLVLRQILVLHIALSTGIIIRFRILWHGNISFVCRCYLPRRCYLRGPDVVKKKCRDFVVVVEMCIYCKEGTINVIKKYGFGIESIYFKGSSEND